MQVLMSSGRPACAFRTKSGSANIGRAIDTKSQAPSASRLSATSGALIRFDATIGTDTAFRSRRTAKLKAARGTLNAIVGTGASCQPMPVFKMSVPAACTASASWSISSAVDPRSTRSIAEMRYIKRKSGPNAARMRLMISTEKRFRFSAEPPQRSVRSLVRGAVN